MDRVWNNYTKQDNYNYLYNLSLSSRCTINYSDLFIPNLCPTKQIISFVYNDIVLENINTYGNYLFSLNDYPSIIKAINGL